MKFYPSRKACEILGIHPNTLRKWADENKIKHIKTQYGQRLYDLSDFSQIPQRKKVCYCRVSSKKQEDDLKRQIEYVRAKYPNHEIISDIGSGINFKRKQFLTLLDELCQGNVEEIVVAHRDRLCRFGFGIFEHLAKQNNCKLVVLDEDKLSPQEELVRDITNIIHIFSCRLNGLRKYKDQIKKDKNLS